MCGDPRILDDLTKVPQVFRNLGGSPLLKMDNPKSLHVKKMARLLGASAGSMPAFFMSDFATGYATLALAAGETAGRK